MRINDSVVADQLKRFFRLGFIDEKIGSSTDHDYPMWQPDERDAYDLGRATAGGPIVPA